MNSPTTSTCELDNESKSDIEDTLSKSDPILTPRDAEQLAPEFQEVENLERPLDSECERPAIINSSPPTTNHLYEEDPTDPIPFLSSAHATARMAIPERVCGPQRDSLDGAERKQAVCNFQLQRSARELRNARSRLANLERQEQNRTRVLNGRGREVDRLNRSIRAQRAVILQSGNTPANRNRLQSLERQLRQAERERTNAMNALESIRGELREARRLVEELRGESVGLEQTVQNVQEIVESMRSKYLQCRRNNT